MSDTFLNGKNPFFEKIKKGEAYKEFKTEYANNRNAFLSKNEDDSIFTQNNPDTVIKRFNNSERYHEIYNQCKENPSLFEHNRQNLTTETFERTFEHQVMPKQVKEEDIASLENELQTVKNEQGIIGGIFNKVKNVTGLGSSSDKCEEAIKSVRQGKMNTEEAREKIREFSADQKDNVELVSNAASYVAAAGAATAVAASGGTLALPLAVIAGAGAGGSTKAGVNFIDRSTNQINDDAFSIKQIRRDFLNGGLNGIATATTMGIGGSIGNVVIKNALSGGISGSITGAGGYVLDTALDKKSKFNASDFIKNTLKGSATCAIAGGLAGKCRNIDFSKYRPSFLSGKSVGVAAENTTSGSLSMNYDDWNTKHKLLQMKN